MSCSSCSCSDRDRRSVVVGLLLLLVGVVIYMLSRVLGGIDFSLSLPRGAWVPLSILAAGTTLFGLWVGFTIHGRGGSLAVGVLGMTVAAVGFVLSTALAFVGVVIVLSAAAWSAAASGLGRTDGWYNSCWRIPETRGAQAPHVNSFLTLTNPTQPQC